MGSNDAAPTFAALNATRLKAFVSYREVISKLAAETGDELSSVAALLKAEKIHEKDMAWLSGHELALSYITDSDPLAALLDYTIRYNAVDQAQYFALDDPGEADPDRFGWYREKLLTHLEIVLGIFSPESLENPSPIPLSQGRAPTWVTPYISRKRIPLSDATIIIAGADPRESYSEEDESQLQFREWKAALLDAAESLEIDVSYSGQVEMLSHADIRSWCARCGHDWPIPDPNPQPATSGEAIAEIERLKAEVTRLRADLTDARDSAIHADHPQCPQELDIAITAWRAAVNGAQREGKKPKAFIEAWLEKTYGAGLKAEQRDRIATVANWDKTPGPRRKKTSQ
jgi:hypothetical protein